MNRPADIQSEIEPVFLEEQRWSALMMSGILLFVVLVNILASFSVLSNGSSGDAISQIFVGVLPITVIILLLFLWFKLETVVTADEIQVGFPIFRRKRINLSDIKIAEVTRYHPLRDFGGWGLRFGKKGIMYNARGDMAVRLVLEDGAIIFIGSQRPEQLLQAILKGQRADLLD